MSDGSQNTDEERIRSGTLDPARARVRLQYLAWFKSLSPEEQTKEQVRSTMKAREDYYRTPHGIATQKAHEEFKKQSAQRTQLFESELVKELKGIVNPTKKERRAAMDRAQNTVNKQLPWRDVPLPI